MYGGFMNKGKTGILMIILGNILYLAYKQINLMYNICEKVTLEKD